MSTFVLLSVLPKFYGVLLYKTTSLENEMCSGSCIIYEFTWNGLTILYIYYRLHKHICIFEYIVNCCFFNTTMNQNNKIISTSNVFLDSLRSVRYLQYSQAKGK